MIRILHCWISAIDTNEIVGTLLLDLSKAFDLVNHNILLQKLKLYGLHSSAVKLFSSYLSNRTQHTYSSGVSSNPGNVVSGVPQGSVLGQTMFLIYINDMSLGLSKSIADIFADDSIISSQSKHFEELTLTFSEDLNKIDHCCNFNDMTINVTKSKVMFVTSKHNHRIIPQDWYIPGISYVKPLIYNVSKLLGVTIDNTLSWSTHVDSVINKCNTYIYIYIFFIPNKIIFVC